MDEKKRVLGVLSPEQIISEVYANCTFDKTRLSFGLEGPCPVAKKADDEKRTVRDQLVLSNFSKFNKVHWKVNQNENQKYSITVDPPWGTLKKGKSVTISVSLMVFCTTKLKETLDFVMSPANDSSIFALKSKSNAPVLQGPAAKASLEFTIDSELSASIDYDEVEEGAKLAAGGFGTVYKAKWRGITVALKKMHAQDITEEEKELYNREIRLMKLLNCPYIVTYIGSTHVKGQPVCLMMEYVQKGALTQHLEQPLSDRLKLKIIADIAQGMAFLHFNNIYHRDLKPDNILVVSMHEDADVNVKITDFDTARAYLKPSSTTKPAEKLDRWLGNSIEMEKDLSKNQGTLVYKAPEIISGATKYPIEKCDVYSFAMLTWQVYTQKHPFAEAPYNVLDVRGIENFVMDGKRLPIEPTIPSFIQTIITDCWAQDPAVRPSFRAISQVVEKNLGEQFSGDTNNPLKRSTDYMKMSPSISRQNIETHQKIGVHVSAEFIMKPRAPSNQDIPPKKSNGSLWEPARTKGGGSMGKHPSALQDEENPSFHGGMERPEAEKMLAGVPGNYLTRFSKGAYVLSYVTPDRGVKHVRALMVSNGLKVEKTDGEDEVFNSLQDLINTMTRRGHISKAVK